MKLNHAACLLLALGTTPLRSEVHKAWTLASEEFAAAKPADTDHSPKAIVGAADGFLESLGPEERGQAGLPLTDPERRKWTNVPPKPDAGGIRPGDLSKPQLERAVALLSTVMSRSGYLKCRNIMLADDLLLKSEEPAKERMNGIESQLEQMHFSWYGPRAPGSDVSYHLFGPALIIEYSGQDLGGDPLDHLHSIYRDRGNEYGARWIGNRVTGGLPRVQDLHFPGGTDIHPETP